MKKRIQTIFCCILIILISISLISCNENADEASIDDITIAQALDGAGSDLEISTIEYGSTIVTDSTVSTSVNSDSTSTDSSATTTTSTPTPATSSNQTVVTSNTTTTTPAVSSTITPYVSKLVLPTEYNGHKLYNSYSIKLLTTIGVTIINQQYYYDDNNQIVNYKKIQKNYAPNRSVDDEASTCAMLQETPAYYSSAVIYFWNNVTTMTEDPYYISIYFNEISSKKVSITKYYYDIVNGHASQVGEDIYINFDNSKSSHIDMKSAVPEAYYKTVFMIWDAEN